MPPTKSILTPQGFAAFLRTVYVHDFRPLHHPVLQAFQRWTILLLTTAWIALVLSAPLLLVLFFVGHNYTPEWLTVALWLTVMSLIALSTYLIAYGVYQYVTERKNLLVALFTGFSLLVGTIGAVLLLSAGSYQHTPPFMRMSISIILGLLCIGLGLHRLVTEQQTHLLFRVAFLGAMLCFGVGLILNTWSLTQDMESATASVQTLRRVLSPSGWILFLIAQIGRPLFEDRGMPRRTRGVLTLTLLTLVVVFVGIILLP